MSTFDQTGQKRKKFVELFKKYREYCLLSCINKFTDNSSVKITIIEDILLKQSTPAQLWDDAADDQYRENLYNGLLDAITKKSKDLLQESNDLIDLKQELEAIPDFDPATITATQSTPSIASTIFQVLGNSMPAVLYHATPKKNLPAIEATGLSSMSRKHVFFFEDSNEAINVASRYGDPDISLISINTDELINDGIDLRKEDFGYGEQWCVNGFVPSKYLIFK